MVNKRNTAGLPVLFLFGLLSWVTGWVQPVTSSTRIPEENLWQILSCAGSREQGEFVWSDRKEVWR